MLRSAFIVVALLGGCALVGACVDDDASELGTTEDGGSSEGTGTGGPGDGGPGDGDPGDGDPGDGDPGDGDGDPGDGDPGDGDPGDGDPGELPAVLFVGNSYTSFNDLPGLVEQLALDSPAPWMSAGITQGGARVSDHLQNPAVVDALSGDWDVIVLQGQSAEPIFDYPGFEAAVVEFADLMAMSGSQARLLLYQTWPRQAGSPDLITLGMSAEEMYQALAEGYFEAALASGAEISPVGDAWMSALQLDPPIELYAGDGSHPSFAGSFVAACVMFGKIADQPCGTSGFTPGELELEDIERLQLIADITNQFVNPSP